MSTEGFKPLDDAGAPGTMRDFRAGQKIFHRYTLKRILGRGGMGIVWLAHDDKLDQEVALKFLPESVRQDPNAVDELKRETRRSLKLTHPNIVRIYDFVDDENTVGISMEFVEGATFAALRSAQPQKIFSPEELMPLIRQLCSALDYAHNEARVVHRDLKPSNLMVTKRAQVKVADFGIARSVSDSMSRITMSQGTSGTLVYMSPQQLGGLPSVPTDDVYALGATLYELLAGRPPFFSGDIPYQIREVKPASVADRWKELEIEARPIPANWEKTIAACLAKNPAQRPQSAGAVAERLAAASALYELANDAPPTMAGTTVPGVKVVAPPVLPKMPPHAVTPARPVPPPSPMPVPEQKKSAAGLIAASVLVVALLTFLGGHFLTKHSADASKSGADNGALNAAEQQRQDEARQHQAALDQAPKTLEVPDQFPRIQSAINAARAGDTVHVHSGLYEEMIKFKDGVKLAGDGADAVTVRCNATEGNALWAQNCATGTVSGITFEHTGENAGENRYAVIALLGSNLELAQCNVQNSAGYGVVIKGGQNTLRGCKLRANTWGGVFVGDKASPLLKDNVAAGNRANGIAFESGATGSAENNNCQNNSFNGISVAGAGTSPTLRDNHCSGNNKHGIIVENGANAIAAGNTCEKNAETGILVSAAGATLTHNQCVKNVKHGITFAAGANGKAERNVCSDNGWSGILVDGQDTTVRLSANRSENNAQWGIISQNSASARIDSDNIVDGNTSGQIQR